MNNKFVRTSNVARLLAALEVLKGRGAPEACMLLVAGPAGMGKSRSGLWWAMQENAVHVRVKAAATPHWLLTDIVRELGDTAPAHSCEKLFAQAVGHLSKHPRAIVIDEVENALHDIKVIETARDISDLVEVPVLLIGREYVPGRLKRYPHIWTRIAAQAQFGPATSDDIRKCATELSEVPIADAVCSVIEKQADGHIREVVKCIANAEAIGLRARAREVTAEMVQGLDLTRDRRGPGK